MDDKLCRKCGETKSLDEFHRNAGKPDGRMSLCAICHTKQSKAYVDKNRDLVRAKQRAYCHENKGARAVYYQGWIQKNREKVNQQKKEYYQRNLQKRREQDKKYGAEHKAEKRIYDRERQRRLCKTSVHHRMAKNLRHRIWGAVKRRNACKSKRTEKLMGCSIHRVLSHLEAQFTKGMTWDNYGKWHVDHIKPCISFDLSKESEQEKCFHYTNLRPLWAKDNQARRRKYHVH